MNKPFVPFSSREGNWNSALESYAAVSAEMAMARANMLIGMVCENMVAGRDSFFGTSQFLDGLDPYEHTRSQQGEE
jgi:hypothetical protein